MITNIVDGKYYENQNELNITYYKGPYNADIFKIKTIKVLHIIGEIDFIQIRNRGLEKLIIDGNCSNIGCLYLDNLLKLKYLSLKNIGKITCLSLPYNLETLKLYATSVNHFNNKSFPYLKNLNVHNFENFTIETPNITKLSTYDNDHYCRFSKLEYITAKGCSEPIDLICNENVKTVKTFGRVINEPNGCNIIEP